MKLEITTTPGVPPKHEVANWPEFDRWAYVNSALWYSVTRRHAEANMTETERLQMLCATLLEENEKLKNLLVEWKQNRG